MISPALTILEEVYEMTINPTQSYVAQLEPLSASGELTNKLKTNEVLFRLCELIDKQNKEIESLKKDREEIAKQMVDLQIKLDDKATDPTKPITDTTL